MCLGGCRINVQIHGSGSLQILFMAVSADDKVLFRKTNSHESLVYVK